MNALKLAIIVVGISISIGACSQSSPKPNIAENVNKTTPVAAHEAAVTPVDDLVAGKELYATNCQICHRDTGKGGKVTIDGKHLDPADLTSSKMKKQDDAKLFQHVSDGVPDEGMPAFKDKLNPEQIKEIVKYVRTLQGV